MTCQQCGRACADGDCAVMFTPITDCEHKDAADGCCHHPKNITPECHVDACPRIHPRLCLIYAAHFAPRSTCRTEGSP
jgi:hypothetical protein